MTFARHHPTYMQGRSAPTSPGILSRSSSRKHLGGGLSRRGSLYDDTATTADVSIVYPVSMREEVMQSSRSSGGMTKAKSEAALALENFQPHRLSGQGVQLSQKRSSLPRSKTATSATPRVRSRMRLGANAEEDWLTHATATTNALLQESRGQSWLSSRDSPAALALPSSDDDDDDDDDDDEGYEELAATAQLSSPNNPGRVSPSSPRAYRWGSRFGSRSASRMTSRRGSLTNLRTPLTTASLEGATSYFDAHTGIGDQRDVAPDFIAEESESDTIAGAPEAKSDEAELKKLVQNPAIGFGGIFDRIAGIGWFAGGDSEDSGLETDLDGGEERRRARTSPPPPPPAGNDGQRVGVWEDAAWLLSIAGRALT
jgi:hypothetical protein